MNWRFSLSQGLGPETLLHVELSAFRVCSLRRENLSANDLAQFERLSFADKFFEFESLPLAIMKKLFALLALAGLANVAAAQQAEIVGDPKAAASKVSMCIGCHALPGYKASFPEVYHVPMIGGQNAKYIEAALNAYKRGERGNPSMRGIAATLSDQDIADLAAYYSQQK